MPGFDTAVRFSTRRTLKPLLFLVGFGLVWLSISWILNGSDKQFIFAGIGVVVVVITIRILENWRDGFYLFVIWLLFEDLVRKYMGNNMAIYFGKDFLIGVIYISYIVAMRRRSLKLFKPPFLVALAVFVWFAVVQIFNPNSPSIVYGLLGIKLYAYYMPILFLGYSLIETDEDLRKFLVVNIGLAGLIASLGIAQSIIGLGFLNPTVLAPDLELLGNLTRRAPISGVLVSRPTSVFVSDGRFASYMVLMFIVGVGGAGYLLMRTRKGRPIVFLSIGLSAVGGVMSGSRAAFLYILGSAAIMSAGMIWGAPWRWREGHRLVRLIHRSFLVIAVGLMFVLLIFPETIKARWAFYSETLSPDSAASELGFRAWQYPVANLMAAFDDPHWIMGNGIGVSSLGMQYLTRILGVPPSQVGVESGFGVLILELGIFGLFLWLIWTTKVMWDSWSVVRKLKETAYFPIAFAILWFTFLLLFLDTFGGFQAFENYINNAYLWLLLGILFRLPSLSEERVDAIMSTKSLRAT